MKKKLVRPCFDRVLVLQNPAVTEENGIIVPDHSQEKPSEGVIVALGPYVNTPRKQYLNGIAWKSENSQDSVTVEQLEACVALDVEFEQTFNLGDSVIFGKWSGVDVTIDGVTYKQLKQDEIISVIVEVEVPDPSEAPLAGAKDQK